MWIAFAALFLTFRRRAARSGGPSRLRSAELRATLRFGLPVGASWMLEYGALAAILNYAILPLGTQTLAAVTSAYSACYVSSLASWGLASGGAILVGQAIGRGARPQGDTRWVMVVRASLTWLGAAGPLTSAQDWSRCWSGRTWPKRQPGGSC